MAWSMHAIVDSLLHLKSVTDNDLFVISVNSYFLNIEIVFYNRQFLPYILLSYEVFARSLIISGQQKIVARFCRYGI